MCSSEPHLSSTPKSGPVGLYAEINDPEFDRVRKQSVASNQSRSNSRTQSRTGSHSEPRSSPIDATTGSITPHDVVSSDDQDPGTATYAQVDYAKKRESRRLREQNKTQPNTDPSDKDYSWV